MSEAQSFKSANKNHNEGTTSGKQIGEESGESRPAGMCQAPNAPQDNQTTTNSKQVELDKSDDGGRSTRPARPGYHPHAPQEQNDYPEDQILPQNQRSQGLQDYDALKRRYDQSGVTLMQAQLLRGFCHQLTKFYEPLGQVALIRDIALLSQLLMMRELEVVFWAALNTAEEIEAIAKRSESELEARTTQAVRSRLLMTAYYTKGKLSGRRAEDAIREFFSHNFDEFVGKHAAWSRDPPDTSRITPRLLNSTKIELLAVYKNEIAKDQENKKETNIFRQDLNQIVALLSEENPDGGKPKQGRRKKVKDSQPADGGEAGSNMNNSKPGSLLTKRPRPDEEQLEQQQRDLEQLHERTARQISGLSAVRYQASDYAPFILGGADFAGLGLLGQNQGNLLNPNVGRSDHAFKRIPSKIYPTTHDNPQRPRFLVAPPGTGNPAEGRAGVVTPSKLMASPTNAGGNGQPPSSALGAIRDLSVSRVLGRREAAYLDRVNSGILGLNAIWRPIAANGAGHQLADGNGVGMSFGAGVALSGLEVDQDDPKSGAGSPSKRSRRHPDESQRNPQDLTSSFSLKNIQFATQLKQQQSEGKGAANQHLVGQATKAPSSKTLNYLQQASLAKHEHNQLLGGRTMNSSGLISGLNSFGLQDPTAQGVNAQHQHGQLQPQQSESQRPGLDGAATTGGDLAQRQSSMFIGGDLLNSRQYPNKFPMTSHLQQQLSSQGNNAPPSTSQLPQSYLAAPSSLAQSNRHGLTRLTSQTWTPASGMQATSQAIKFANNQFMHDQFYNLKTQDSRQHELKRSGDDEDQK